MNKSKQKQPTKKTFDRLAYAIAAYVKESGGNAVVIGGISISKRDKFRFTLGVDFTGTFPA